MGRATATLGIKQGVNDRHEVENELRQWIQDHHGVVGAAEARRLGATTDMFRAKLRRGEWAHVHRSVFRETTWPTSHYQSIRAAHVATGARTVASHVSAAWIWGLLREPTSTPDLTVHSGDGDYRALAGVRIHRSKDLDVAKAVLRNTILVTNPLRTLVDLASVVLPGPLTEAVDTALSTRLVTVPGLEAEIDRLSRQGRPGVAALRFHLHERGYTGAPAPSVLEAQAWRLIQGTGLPLPEVEVRVGDEAAYYRLDLAWAAILLAIEVDGYLWHFSPEQKERDETRRNRLRRMGWTVLVYNWRQVVRDPAPVADEIIAVYRRLEQP